MPNNSEPIDTHSEAYKELLATLHTEAEAARADAASYRAARRAAALDEDAEDYAAACLAAEKAEVLYKMKLAYLQWYGRELFNKETLEAFEARAPWLNDSVEGVGDVTV